MGYSFLEFMKRIGIFIICAQSILHFAAEKSYEKYIKVLVGIMILAQFIVPVRALLLGADKGEIWSAVEEFQGEMDKAMEDVGVVYEKEEDGKLTQALEEEIKENLAEIAGNYGYGVSEVFLYEEPPKLTVKVFREKNGYEGIAGREEEEAYGINKVDEVKIDVKVSSSLSEEKGAYPDGAKKEAEGSYINGTGEDAEEIKEMKKEFCTRLGTDESYVEIIVK